MTHTQGMKKETETACERAQILDLTDKDFKTRKETKLQREMW